jgi:hypothetical protein
VTSVFDIYNKAVAPRCTRAETTGALDAERQAGG